MISLDLMPKKSNQTIVLSSDFNIPGIDWDNVVFMSNLLEKKIFWPFRSQINDEMMLSYAGPELAMPISQTAIY